MGERMGEGGRLEWDCMVIRRNRLGEDIVRRN